jgi:hypothetical protein
VIGRLGKIPAESFIIFSVGGSAGASRWELTAFSYIDMLVIGCHEVENALCI